MAAIAVLAVASVTAMAPAGAAPANPTPGTDLFASALPLVTGGTARVCATSPLGITVRCVERVVTMPSALPGASGVTFGHWIFCKATCTGGLLVHEMVHVSQFERYGDAFGPLYLVEAVLHGTGCENQWEKPAYQTGGQCL